MATAGPSTTSAKGAQNKNENATYQQSSTLELELHPTATDPLAIPLYLDGETYTREMVDQDFEARLMRAFDRQENGELATTLYELDGSELSIERPFSLKELTALPSKTLATSLLWYSIRSEAYRQQTSIAFQLANQQAKRAQEKDDEISILISKEVASPTPASRPQSRNQSRLSRPTFTTPMGKLTPRQTTAREPTTPVPEGEATQLTN